MALILLQVLVLGVTAAAVDDVGVTWSADRPAPCALADWARPQSRRPPPPLVDDRRAKPYYWNDITPKRLSQNGTLEVMRNGEGDELHPCAVRHHGGIVLGYPVALKYSLTDKQLKSPRDKKATSQPLVVPCAVAPEYVGNSVLENNRFFSVQTGSFSIDIKGEDAVQYRCKATKQKGRSSWAGYGRTPDFLKEDYSYYDEESDTRKVLLTCPLHSRPRVNLTWELTPPGGMGDDDALVLPNLEHDKDGVYTCVVVGDGKNATVEPIRMVHPPVSKQARRASTVRFNCTAAGGGPHRIIWYKDGRPLVTSGRINVRNSADGQQRPELVIGGLTVNDTGVYQCFAFGRSGFVSGWAQLHVNVTGPAASPPVHVRCAPLGDHAVEVRWRNGTGDLAYTVHIKPKGVSNNSEVTALPINTTSTISELDKPLTPYQFQVVAYLTHGASDPSHTVVCQGQGVPIKLTKSGEDQVLVSWRSFAEQTPGVAEWILQYRPQDNSSSPERNVTLAGEINNYTITVTPRAPLLVRVLGSRTLEWLPQNLTIVPWTSTARAGETVDDGRLLDATVEDVVVTLVRARSVTLRWRCVRCPPKHSFHVCALSAHPEADVCRDSMKPNATIEGLSPGTEYEIRVQVQAGGRSSASFSAPYQVFTLLDGPQRFKDLTYKFVNESALLVSWSGAPAVYTVHHSAQLTLPDNRWAAKQVDGNSVLINGIQPSQHTYVMVTGYDPLVYSPILTVPPPRDKDSRPQRFKDLMYKFVNESALLVTWSGAPAVYTVHYSAQRKLPVERWAAKQVDGNSVLINGIQPSQHTYVMVTGYDPLVNSTVLTVPPREKDSQESKDYKYEYTNNGVVVRWMGGGSRLVRYSQNITRPVEHWATANASGGAVELEGLETSLPLYVLVTDADSAGQILTIPPRPPNNDFNLSLGLGFTVGVLCVLAVAAAFFWRRRKKAQLLSRARRGHGTTSSPEEEGSEMKAVGARLCNGAGEPLLNGHVHITENPASKTPNGRVKRGRWLETQFQAFDLSRTDADTTQETILDESCDPTKLPDDNMNVEPGSRDNSQAQPTLQPNG